MPNFLRSLFSSTPKVQFVSGHRVAHTKTVGEVLGDSFDYVGSMRAGSAFCKKLLITCAKRYSTENLLFVLMAEKYAKTPNPGLFNHIYNEFIKAGSPREVNISGSERVALTVLGNLGDPGSSNQVFETSAKEIKNLIKRDMIDTLTVGLKAIPFETAFIMSAPEQKAFDEAIVYLKTHQIILL